MAEFPAQAFVLSVDAGSSPSSLATVGALIDCTLEISDTEDDITSKSDAGAQRIYETGTVKGYQFSGNLVVTDNAAYTELEAAKESSTPAIFARVDDGKRTYTGTFFIPTLSKSGGNQGAVRAAVTLRSSGAIAVAAS